MLAAKHFRGRRKTHRRSKQPQCRQSDDYWKNCSFFDQPPRPANCCCSITFSQSIEEWPGNFASFDRNWRATPEASGDAPVPSLVGQCSAVLGCGKLVAAKKKERRPDRSSYLISVMAILHGRNKANWIPTFTAVSM